LLSETLKYGDFRCGGIWKYMRGAFTGIGKREENPEGMKAQKRTDAENASRLPLRIKTL
jgi:hypothetical protein